MAKVQHVLGGQELLDTLTAIGAEVPRTAIRRALYAGAVLIRDDARRRVPVRTGALKRSIIAQTDRTQEKSGQYKGYVSIKSNAFTRRGTGRVKLSKKEPGQRKYAKGEIYPRNYAHLVEFGTQPHKAGPRNHPGSKPQPFMRPALDENIAAIERVFAATIEKEVRRIAEKKAGRKGR